MAKSTISQVIFWVTIGIIAWTVAGVILLATGAEAKYIWTCVVGIALGVIGIPYAIRRNRRTPL